LTTAPQRTTVAGMLRCPRIGRGLLVAAVIFLSLSCRKPAASPAAAAAASTAESDTVKIQLLVTVPEYTDPNSKIYLAGNLGAVGGWRADGAPLRRLDEDHTWTATLELPRGKTLEYKITRGSWATVEKGPAGEEVANRALVLNGNSVERVRVARWSNEEAREKISTITGDVRSHPIHSNILNNDRKLWVFVPPGYDADKSARYPVLYMHDGQNLFDDATSFAGEWQADETATKLIHEGKIRPILIVGIENTAARGDEYTPTRYDDEGGRGQDYARFVLTEVKPFIDRTYRTNPSREATGIAGSSLGGLISLYIAKTYPDTFGKCGAVSPSLWWDHEKLLHELESDRAWTKGAKVWIDTGTAENSDTLKSATQVMDCRALASLLQRAGLKENQDYLYFEDPGAAHNEAAWAKRFGAMLEFMYGGK
jgi:predicted alpha/beta superfamily hydrolase